MKHIHDMPFGTALLPGGGIRFALWAPTTEKIVLELGAGEEPHAMQRDGDGFHRVSVATAKPGDDYRFRLPDGLRVPDPTSRHNPGDVHGASRIVDPGAYEWQHNDWRGRPWREAVIYELHIGSFTPEGTFAAAQKRLPELAELGITAVELMPLADFPGQRGWGYDGVLEFAPDASYGTPDELKALVDAAHGLGLMMLIDVVYNHFGPEGNYLHAYCPQFFNPAHQTPWGAAINYDGEHSRTVRDFFIHNALYWVEEFGFDGLRMDAIHAIRDDTDPHNIVREICAALHAGPGRDRHVHVALENEANEASLLERDAVGEPIAGSAQWNDDLHHAAHVVTTGETEGYYIDFAHEPLSAFGTALAEGFVYQGQASVLNDGKPRGEPTVTLPAQAFVSYLQTHDQVGNRAFGERIHMIGSDWKLRAAYTCLLLSPHVPMFFMGEEYAASTPFLYFCDFGPELAAAVTEGRRAEFGKFPAFANPALRERIPDPNDVKTFEASKLVWSERETGPHAEQLALVRELLALRRQHLVPHLEGTMEAGRHGVSGSLLQVDWTLGDGSLWHMAANFGDDPTHLAAEPAGCSVRKVGLTSVDGDLHLAPGGVVVSCEVHGG